MLKQMVTGVVTLLLAAQEAGAELKTDDEKTLYVLGVAISQNLAPFSLTPDEVKLVQQGLADGVAGGKLEASLEEFGPKIQAFAATRATQAAAKEKEASKAFLEKATGETGATKLPSGVIYIETAAGTGANPAPTDQVKVHYHGTLISGDVFDSSRDRGEPITFPLNGVIPCWTEGVQKMKVGGKAKLVCPSESAYGDRGAPPKIKPGATLIFEVELLGIEAPPAIPAPTAPTEPAEPNVTPPQ